MIKVHGQSQIISKSPTNRPANIEDKIQMNINKSQIVRNNRYRNVSGKQNSNDYHSVNERILNKQNDDHFDKYKINLFYN